MAKITPIDIIKGVSRKIGGGNSKEYFATNKCSYHIHLAKRVNSSVRAPFELRSSSVQPPFELRSTSVRAPFGDRRSIEEWSKNKGRIIGGKTEMYRNSNGKPRERQPEQKNAQNPPQNPMLPISRKNFEKTFNAKNPENQHLIKNCQKFLQKNFKKHLVIIEKRRTFALANQK